MAKNQFASQKKMSRRTQENKYLTNKIPAKTLMIGRIKLGYLWGRDELLSSPAFCHWLYVTGKLSDSTVWMRVSFIDVF